MTQARTYRFVQVDVFTDHVFGGNPLAVFLDGQGLTAGEMGNIAREMNLSETTFILPAEREGCAARVRIFTPGAEVPFAGHPTLGTGWVLATRGRLPAGATAAQLDEGVGAVAIQFEGDPAHPERVWLQSPPVELGPEVTERSGVAEALDLEETDLLDKPIVVGAGGLPFLYVPLLDRMAVDDATLNLPVLPHIEGNTNGCVFVFAPDGPNRVYSRMFGPGVGVPEDPATGSASGPLGAYLVRHGLADGEGDVDILSEQGTMMGRQSFVHIRVRVEGGEPLDVQVGGGVVPVLEGELTLPD